MPRVCFKIIPAPVGLGFASVLGPTHGWVANVGCSLPLFCCGGTSPKPPARGPTAPWTPQLPTLACLGFAWILGPTRGGVARVGNSLPLLVFGGTSPKPPGRGLRPLHPPSPPSLAEDSPAFWVPLVGGLQGLVTRPFLSFRGGTPPTPPRHGGFTPLDPLFCPPS